MTVKTIILKSGLEIISEVEKRGGRWILTRPYRVFHTTVLMPAQQGISIQAMIQTAPLIASAANELVLRDEDILGEPMETFKSAEDQYLQQTTGIQLTQ